MFKIKNLVALCCFWAITLAATAAWSAICFAPSGGCQEGGEIGVDNGDGDSTRKPGSIDSCPGYDLYEKLTGKGYEDDNGNSLCESCVQNGTTYWRCKAHQCATKFDRVDKEGEPEEGYDCEDCYSANDVLWHCVPHPCDAKYKLEKNDYHRDCSDTCVSARKTLYNCVCDAEHPLEVGGKCIKECNGYAEEYVEDSDSCECQTGYTRRNGICSREDVSASCEDLLDKFTRVQYTKMSNSDCEANKKALGITQCIGQDDYWVGAVKACGGIGNMPTGDEMFELAKCMYGLSVADSSMYGTRKDSYLEELGLNTGDHVFVWQDYQSTNNKRSIVRMFAKNGSIPYWAERNGNNYYTGNGTNATNWENTSILSETLCHRKKSEANCADLAKRFETKSYSAISQSTCNSNKSALSITNCPVSTDYWAGAVKACGGVDMIASEDDLFELAKCMYGKTQASSSMYGTRNNTYLSSLGLSTNSHEYVWSAYQNNKGDHNAIVRMFASDGSIPYWAERDGSKYYEGNGSYPTDWKSSGIKSKVLCRKESSAEPVETCASGYTITTKPKLGQWSECGGKYKCDAGTFINNSSTPACYTGCDMLNWVDGVYVPGTSPEKYVTTASQCPSGTTGYPTGKLFDGPVFAGTSMYRMECYHCESSSCHDEFLPQCNSWGGTLKSKTTQVIEDTCHAVFGKCGSNYYYCLKPGCSD